MSTTELPLATTDGNYSWSNDSDHFLFGTDLYFHPHWQQHSETIFGIPDYVHYLLGIYIGIVGIVGTIGNALVIYIFATTKSLRTPPNMFIINLAISDLGFSAVNGFPLMTIACFMKKWSWGMVACQIYGFLGGIFGFNSINTLAWISLDRYYVIAYPFDAMRKCTKKRALLQILFVWFWATIWSIPPFFGWGRYIPEGLHTSCSFDYLTNDVPTMTHVWTMFVGGFMCPVVMIFVCYINIVRTISNQAKSMAQSAAKMGAKPEKDEKARRQEIELTKIAAGTISLFLLSWTPYAIIALLGITGFTGFVTPYSCQIPVMFAKASAMWNPMIYALSHPRFRAVLEAKFPWILFCKNRAIDKGDDKDDKSKVSKSADQKRNRNDTASELSSEISEIETTVDEPRVCSTPQPARQQIPMDRQPMMAATSPAMIHTQQNGAQGSIGYANPAFRADNMVQQGVPMMLNAQNQPVGSYALPQIAMIPAVGYYPPPPAVPGHYPYPPGYPYYPPPPPHARRSRRQSDDSDGEEYYNFSNSPSDQIGRRSEVATQCESDDIPMSTLVTANGGAAKETADVNANNSASSASSPVANTAGKPSPVMQSETYLMKSDESKPAVEPVRDEPNPVVNTKIDDAKPADKAMSADEAKPADETKSAEENQSEKPSKAPEECKVEVIETNPKAKNEATDAQEEPALKDETIEQEGEQYDDGCV